MRVCVRARVRVCVREKREMKNVLLSQVSLMQTAFKTCVFSAAETPQNKKKVSWSSSTAEGRTCVWIPSVKRQRCHFNKTVADRKS